MRLSQEIVYGRELICPIDDGDHEIELFHHCSNNAFAVTPEFFVQHVEPMLYKHGVRKITIINLKGEK